MNRSFSRHSVIALLDSSFRWNDSEARIRAIRLPVCVYCFVVIPAKARIQWLIEDIPA